MNRMAFQKLDFGQIPEVEMIARSRSFHMNITLRRTVRDFSSQSVPMEVVTNAIKSASSAPSGANKQPWHFVLVKDPLVKKEVPSGGSERKEKKNKEFQPKQLVCVNQWNLMKTG